MHARSRYLLTCGIAVLAVTLSAQVVTREMVPGVTNFAKLETTIACAGATTSAAVPGLKKMGYAAIINLREANEAGADIAGEEAAAQAAGITFIHLPLNSASPDPTVVDGFLKAVTAPANQPVFVHCASGNRAAAMWMIKRMVVDKWDADRASTEAAALGLTHSPLKTFALDYAKSHTS